MTILLRTNPLSDSEFRRRAEALLADGVHSPTELQVRLNDGYPEAVVVSGIDDRGSERWYAYREGRWVSSDQYGSPRDAT